MSDLVFLLLLFAALGHSVWNAISKQIPNRDEFFTLILMIAVILYFPLAAYMFWKNPIPLHAWSWISISIFFEVLYFVSLANAYQKGSFLTVYPVARGSAPIFVTLISFLFMRQFTGMIGLLGIILTVTGIFFINQKRFSLYEMKSLLSYKGSRWALAAGICTASYSVADSLGVALMSAILFKYIVFVGMGIGKFAYDRHHLGRVSYLQLLKQHPFKSLLGGVLVFGVNILVVISMKSTPVAFVSATREISIIFASIIGVLWLKEKIGLTKGIAILLVFAGVILMKAG